MATVLGATTCMATTETLVLAPSLLSHGTASSLILHSSAFLAEMEVSRFYNVLSRCGQKTITQGARPGI